MQSENSNSKGFLGQSTAKWAVAASLSVVLLLSTFFLIGLKSQYIAVDFCILSANCSQTAKPGTSDYPVADGEYFPEDSDSPTKPIRIVIKPLGAAVISGVTSTAAMTALVGLGLISIPLELALALGVLVSSGTYFALKALS
jgi:hypothetical protein